METADQERPLLQLQTHPQAVGSEYTSDASVDINNRPALKHCTGNWRACFLIIGVEFCECLAFFSISTNLVTYLTTVLHESKVTAARNASTWVGASFLAPLFGAFIADTYWGRYWTIAVFLPVYIIAMLILIASASLPVLSTCSNLGSNVHRPLVYLGLYLAAIAGGGVKPCTATFGADQFDPNDPVELAKKGSFFNWYFFLITTSSLLSGTVIVWLQENVGWGVGYVIPTVLMLFCFIAFLAGSRVYRFRKMGVSPIISIFQVVVAAVRNRHVKLPDNNSFLHELTSSPPEADASHKINHTNQFRFFDKAAIAPSDNKSRAQMSSWRLCTMTQVEELKMLLQMFPTWASFVIYYAVSAQMQSTLVEQGMFMDNRVGSFAIPPASMSIVDIISVLIWVPVYETVLVPLARRFTGNDKGFTMPQRLGIGQALSMLTMVYAALLETRRLDVAEANGLTDQSLPVPMSILWQLPLYLMHGAANVFGTIGVTEFFYDSAPVTMKSLCAALGQLAVASGSIFNSLVLSLVAVATTHGGAPGWIPDNLNEGHLDYFFWMMATLNLLNLTLFVRYSMRCRGRGKASLFITQ
ncbi:unnamed protein product [Urochloa decumbens]|uniref:Uncharacterized protein n=1 Tax=Urochloa decumbens TaxID=240449 RepID=A0ABC8XX59_9POAL